jgi:hypothetical protein
MSDYTNCQGCGRKLTSAFFCVPCRLSFCCMECLNHHSDRNHGSASPRLARKKSGPLKGSATPRSGSTERPEPRT